MQPPLFPHEGIFIALDGSAHEEWIGMSGMSIHHWGDFAFNEMTGVLPTYTGRGIAQALKLLSTQFAQQQGVSIVRTINDVGNAPMLAVNQKLGYMPQGGFYFTKRWL
jgi:RimJ/RimL family protein N-acetyltransferase